MRWLVALTTFATMACTASGQCVATGDMQGKKPPQAQELRASGADKDPHTAPSKLRPTPQMKRLSRLLVGRWQVEEKYEISPFTPQGGEAKGEDMVHRGPGGLSIITNYKSSGTMGEFHGAGIITWSADDNAFQQFWVDSSLPGGQLWQGKFDGDTLVMKAKVSMGDQPVFMQQKFSGFSNESFLMTLDAGPSEDQLKPFMSMRFTRMARQSANGRRHGTGMHGRPSEAWGSPRAAATLLR